MVKNLPAMQADPGSYTWEWKIPWRRDRLCTPVFFAAFVAQLVKSPPAMWDTWVGKIPWRREKLPVPVFWPGGFHGLYSPWGHKESDTTE